MKYAIFIGFALAFIPWVASMAGKSSVNRERLLAFLVFSPALGGMANVNFASMETYRGPDRGFEVTLTDLIVWGLAVYLLSRRRKEVAFIPLGSAFMATFFLAACVSATQAPMQIGAVFTIWKLFRLSIVFWTVANMLRVGVNPRAMFYGWATMGLVFTAECLYQKYKLHMYRVQGFFDHSNGVPIFLDQAISFVLLTALGDKGLSAKWVWAGVLSALGMTFCVIATQSRMGIAITAGLLLITLVLVNIVSKAQRTRLVSAFVLLCLCVGGGMAAKTIITRIQTAPESSAEARVEFNIAADLMAQDRPLGVGLNNFSYVLTSNSHYNGHIEVMAAEIENGQGGVAHHIYKLTAAEMGKYGLVLFLLLIGRFLLAGLKAGWKGRKSLVGYQAWALVVGSMAMHAIGNFEWSLRVTTVASMFAVCSGGIVGYASIVSNIGKPKPGKGAGSRPPRGSVRGGNVSSDSSGKESEASERDRDLPNSAELHSRSMDRFKSMTFAKGVS